MKLKNIFAFLLLLVVGLQSVWAKQAYIVLNNGTLTFYCDDQFGYRPGTTYPLPTANIPSWRDNASKVVSVVFDPSFASARPTTTRNWFSNMENLTSITGISYLNTSEVTHMSFMFDKCKALTTLDVSHFNTDKVEDMSYMFRDCRSLTTLDVSHFNTSNVELFDGMFNSCESLTSLDVTGFNTSKAEYMDIMFDRCIGLTSLDVSNFDTSNVKDMELMFRNCKSLTSLDLSNFQTSNVTNMFGLFDGCIGLTSIDLRNFQTSNVTNMSKMFHGCESMTSLDLSAFNTENVTNMFGLFDGCKSLTRLNLTSFNTTKVESMELMFSCCSVLKSLDISQFNIGNVTDVSQMFDGCKSLTTVYVGEDWSTENVKHSRDMFLGCTSLVGGAGTTYDPDHIDASYAHVDGGTSYPGYLTLKAPAEHYDFRYGGIYYLDIIGGNWEAAVTYEDTDYGTYSGDVIIPEEVMNSINEVFYTVTCIGERAFYRCPYLTSVTLPATINRIENEAFVDAFLDASNSTMTCLAKTPPTISPLAFGSEIQSMTLYVRKDCKAAYEAHDVWKQFGNIVELPYHFQVRNAYYQITGENTVSVVNRDANYYSYWSQVTIPPTVTYEGVTYTVNKIANVAFFKCPELIRVIMPSTITSIGNRSFKDCTRLTSITLPENLQSIGVYAFDGCTALTDITCLATTPPTISYDTFTGSQYRDGNLYVPYGCYNLYWNAPNWEYFRNIFELPPDDDAVNEITETVKDAPYYDLQGRKVSNPRKGIYIKDGKMVLVK